MYYTKDMFRIEEIDIRNILLETEIYALLVLHCRAYIILTTSVRMFRRFYIF